MEGKSEWIWPITKEKKEDREVVDKGMEIHLVVDSEEIETEADDSLEEEAVEAVDVAEVEDLKRTSLVNTQC